uniref:Uncharacterized protein n=1 Tax=Cacopsylla melanoneura TaxID=428564 RepID=A0A8D8XPL6_9HEMI
MFSVLVGVSSCSSSIMSSRSRVLLSLLLFSIDLQSRTLSSSFPSVSTLFSRVSKLVASGSFPALSCISVITLSTSTTQTFSITTAFSFLFSKLNRRDCLLSTLGTLASLSSKFSASLLSLVFS